MGIDLEVHNLLHELVQLVEVADHVVVPIVLHQLLGSGDYNGGVSVGVSHCSHLLELIEDGSISDETNLVHAIAGQVPELVDGTVGVSQVYHAGFVDCNVSDADLGRKQVLGVDDVDQLSLVGLLVNVINRDECRLAEGGVDTVVQDCRQQEYVVLEGISDRLAG